MNEAVGSTKDRLLDTAERLFAKSGIDAVSLRDITAEAGVNLAAVNYHFQSKDSLMEAVICRRIEPVNRRFGRKLLADENYRGALRARYFLEEIADLRVLFRWSH